MLCGLKPRTGIDGLTGYMRPGCVHITVDSIQAANGDEVCESAFITHLEDMLSGSKLHSKTVEVQTDTRLYRFHMGRCVQADDIANRNVATVVSVQLSSADGCIQVQIPFPLTVPCSPGIEIGIMQVLMRNYCPENTSPILRMDGEYIDCETLHHHTVDADHTTVTVRYSGAAFTDLVWIQIHLCFWCDADAIMRVLLALHGLTSRSCGTAQLS